MKKGLRQFMLILASGSPRRQDLLKQVELNFLTIISNVDESSVTETDPKEKAMTLARLKSHAIDNDEDIILSCDTLIHFNGEILENQKTKTTHGACLKCYQGTPIPSFQRHYFVKLMLKYQSLEKQKSNSSI